MMGVWVVRTNRSFPAPWWLAGWLALPDAVHFRLAVKAIDIQSMAGAGAIRRFN